VKFQHFLSTSYSIDVPINVSEKPLLRIKHTVNSEVSFSSHYLDSHYKMPSNQNVVFPEVVGAVNIFSMICNDERG